jgi:hypothetical protein
MSRSESLLKIAVSRTVGPRAARTGRSPGMVVDRAASRVAAVSMNTAPIPGPGYRGKPMPTSDPLYVGREKTGPDISKVSDDTTGYKNGVPGYSDDLATKPTVLRAFDPIKTASAVAQGGATHSAGYMGGAFLGGATGYMMSDEGDKGFGTFGGAISGMVAAKGFREFGRGGKAFTQSVFEGADKRLGHKALGPVAEGWNKHKGVVQKGIDGFHSAEGRNTLFRSGAMLGGGAFGLMFASNGRSHKRGFNKDRGNSFTR